MAISGSTTRQLIEVSLKADKERSDRDSVTSRDDLAKVVDYINGNMKQDVVEQLQLAYASSQAGENKEGIRPVTLNVVERHADEMATIYAAGNVRRTLVNEAGEVDEEQTKKFNDALEEIGYDQILNSVERAVVVMKACTTMYSSVNGKLDVQVFYNQNVYPVPPLDEPYAKNNQDEYCGFVLDTQTRLVQEDGSTGKNLYAFVEPERTTWYTGAGPDAFDVQQDVQKNPWKWEQTKLDKNGRPIGTEQRPGQLVLVWHAKKPTGELIPLFEPSIFISNREMNVLWSMLFDIMRFQGGAVPVITSMDQEPRAGNRAIGVRHGVNLSAADAEDFKFESPTNDYSGLTNMLHTFNRLVAIMARMNPNDFSVDSRAPQSGFAKVIENLPKLAARRDRMVSFSQLEQEAYLRIRSILIWLKKLDKKAEKLDLVTQFKELEIPTTPGEMVQKDEHDLKNGFRSATQILAARDDITEEAAEELIKANLKSKQELFDEFTPPELKTALSSGERNRDKDTNLREGAKFDPRSKDPSEQKGRPRAGSGNNFIDRSNKPVRDEK